ncbi:DUF4430 domain-containing protein [candidate division GN15 bacterium]|nr:DUF4430 domain-containing protein [candidate division GN15 bacterium]
MIRLSNNNLRRVLQVLGPSVFLLLLVSCQDGTQYQEGTAYADSLILVQIAPDSVTVLELLERDHEVQYTSSAMGAFVDMIDSVGGDEAYFWLYSVNSEMGQTAADKHILDPGDTVKWHYQLAP